MGNKIGRLLKGAVAGAVGVWLMDRVTWNMYRNEDPEAHRQEKEAQVGGHYAAHAATAKALNSLNIQLPGDQFFIAGKGVHYMMGVVPGALYAAYKHKVPQMGNWRGLLYGLGLYLVVDEVVVPMLGFASGPTAYPWQAHVRGLVGHLVMGGATDTVLNLLDKSLPE